MNKAFEEFMPTIQTDMRKAFEAGQSSSAARIDRLERLCDATEQQLTWWRNKYNHAIETGVVKIADEQARIAEMEKETERLQDSLDGRDDDCKLRSERIAELERKVEELERLAEFQCADCQDTGWLENRVEGKYPCTCMTEVEPYQILESKVAELEAENAEINEALLVQNSTIVDLGNWNIELEADCKAMSAAIFDAEPRIIGELHPDHPEVKSIEAACTIAAKYREGK